MKLLENKIALITGTARGIGRRMVEVFAAHGATVAYTNIHHNENIDSLAAQLDSMGAKSHFYEVDASDLNATQKMMDDLISRYGRIDVVVNNAGITKDGLLLRMSEEQWQQVLNVNLNSVFVNTKVAIKYMMKQRSGAIINISSVVGTGGNAGQANYAASKAGIIGFSKSVAKELGSRNIRCNVVAPGFIETEMTAKLPEKEIEAWNAKIPLQRAGTADDVANLCAFLGSDLATYLTGQVISIDGGMTM